MRIERALEIRGQAEMALVDIYSSAKIFKMTSDQINSLFLEQP